MFSLFVGILPQSNVSASQVTPEPSDQQKVKDLMAKMTPNQRVAQLFLVTFKGKQIDRNTQIYDLVLNHSIGGVVLRAANDNFSGPVNTAKEVYTLSSALQTHAWEGTKGLNSDSIVPQAEKREYIPLFIAVAQEGDGNTNDQILYDVTRLPNEMAIGATWKPDLAEGVGKILGNELQVMGINMLFGPSLDVLEVRQSSTGQDLGTRTFGGDPYWVGEMGKAYIKGVHEGSSEKLAVISKHFPGRGSSDRPPEEEIATVRKSLEQLKQFDLAPFFAVTGSAPDANSTTDGLLVSHIRYQGFQKNFRDTTRPVSFDPSAFEQLMSLPQFASWRQAGGIVVSDDLGSQAVRRFYDPTGLTFDARQVARNAFLAGNDLLYVDNFTTVGDPDSYTTLLRTLDFFTQKYQEDPAFAQRVDVSVERILTLKYHLYPNFELDTVIPPEANLSQLGQNKQLTFDVAQRAITLLSPDLPELSASLPKPPQTRDRIVFITDVRTERQCSQCVEEFSMPQDALQKAVVRLYGPQAGEQVLQYKLSSYSFNELLRLLNGAPDLPPIESDIRSADWIVFAMTNISVDRPESLAMRRFLSERPDLITNKKIIAFAFNAPYYLDATDISKLTAYYGLYSKSQPFIDVAARALFQELAPSGALPVSVSGVGYDLITATSPDPTQVIPLFLNVPEIAPVSSTPGIVMLTPTKPTSPAFKVGDSIPLSTGVIYDHNHNTVPDGTVVRFLFSQGGETAVVQQMETITTKGVARANFRIQNEGMLEIRVVSDPANVSDILRLNVSFTGEARITAIAPTHVATSTQQPTSTLTVTPQPTSTSSPLPVTPPGSGSWLFAVILTWFGAIMVYAASQQSVSTRWGVRWGLLTSIGGLASYTLLMIGWPLNFVWLQKKGFLGLAGVIVLGMALGFAVGFFWRWKETRPVPPKNDQKIMNHRGL
jgi:beta-N-acetylhexosaminidase